MWTAFGFIISLNNNKENLEIQKNQDTKLQEIWNMTFFCCPCLSQQSSNDADENELQKQKNTLDSTKENPNDQPGGSSQYSAASGVSRMLLLK